ncbi:MAG: PAS domain S-box protein [Methylibium sp.]|uniref:PAS domain S-box protein n=1 Tax=Methylibium sp. TaxID=2067992 RepID=UPI00181276BA|nr:PAS domain S-box protein [Methylibium sp.]MBA3597273.1 PAS domain S-box protein [Methylibium sp.]
MTTSSRVNILLVSNEHANLLGLRAVLEDLVENLVCASSAEQALSQTGATDFAAILIDVRSPPMSAFETARLIRSQPGSKATPILFLTGADTSEFPVEGACALGAVDFLAEPLVPAVLECKVAVFVELARRRAEGHSPERQAVEAAFTRQKELWQTTLESIGDAVIATDSQRRVSFLNSEGERLTGWSRSEALGQDLDTVFVIVNEETRKKVECPVDKVLRTGRVVGLANHTVLIARDGTERPIDDSAAPIRSESGDVHGVVLVFRDITEKHEAAKKLEEAHAALERRVDERTAELANERAFLAAVLEAVEDGIVACSADGVLTLFNRATRQLHRLPEQPLPADRWADYYDLYRVDGTTPLPTHEIPLRRALQGELVRDAEMVIAPRGGGTPRTLLASGRSFADAGGRKLGAVVSMHDVTARHEAQAAREATVREQVRRQETEAAAERLRQSKERFELLLDSSGEGIVGMESDGSCTFVNGAAAAMLGYRPQELLGRSVRDVIRPWQADGSPDRQADDTIERAARNATAIRVDDALFQHKDGPPVPVSYSVNPMTVDGRNTGAVITFTDITQRKRAEEELRTSEARYRTLFETVDEGFCVIEVLFDAASRPVDYRFLETNPAFKKHTGLDRAVGRTARDLVPTLDNYWFETYGRVALTGTPERFESEAPAMERWFDVSASRIGGVESRKVALVFNDITVKKKAEDGLRRLAADLSEADQRKTEFLATLAHELRNPLAPLSNGLQVMRLAAGDAVAVGKARGMMERQLAHMVHLVGDLLDVARITGGKVELRKQRVALAGVVANAVETSLPLIEAGRHELSIDIPEQALLLDVDTNRIAQVLSNLLNNAAKYTAPGGHIRLSAAREEGAVIVSVTDNGIGIPSESLGSVFDMFAQVGRNMDRAQGGLGVGLTLVRRLVELHGGTVTAESPGVGQGSSFRVRLPIAVADDAPSRSGVGGAVPAGDTDPAFDAAVKSFRVLVVDDNTDAAESLSDLLQIGGHTTRVANDGHQAIRMAREFQPHLVFLDIGIPGKNGYEVARALRKTPGLEQVTLAALTGWGAEEDRVRSKDAGFDHHFTKPAEFELINGLLSQLAAPSTSTPAD